MRKIIFILFLTVNVAFAQNNGIIYYPPSSGGGGSGVYVPLKGTGTRNIVGTLGVNADSLPDGILIKDVSNNGFDILSSFPGYPAHGISGRLHLDFATFFLMANDTIGGYTTRFIGQPSLLQGILSGPFGASSSFNYTLDYFKLFGSSGFQGFQYDATTAGYVAASGDGTTVYDRDYNDSRYARGSTLSGGWTNSTITFNATTYTGLATNGTTTTFTATLGNRNFNLINGSVVTGFYISVTPTGGSPAFGSAASIYLTDVTTSTDYLMTTIMPPVGLFVNGKSYSFYSTGLSTSINNTHDYTLKFVVPNAWGSSLTCAANYYFVIR